jgi:hypothetical protein
MLAFLERMASKMSSRRKRRSCCCHGVCIGFLRPEAQSQETEIEHETMKQFNKKGIAERDFIAENTQNSLICKADGGIEVHDDSGWKGDGLRS